MAGLVTSGKIADLSDFPLANSCGNGTYVFELS
jgi:hypothetical protein